MSEPVFPILGPRKVGTRGSKHASFGSDRAEPQSQLGPFSAGWPV